jgi:hypothetical protein
MKKFKMIRLDDIDGNEATETVRFSYQGKAYEIDLTDDNRYRLEKVLDPFISHARSTGGNHQEPASEHRKARAWAMQRGVSVGVRGPVPTNVMSDYQQSRRSKTAA